MWFQVDGAIWILVMHTFLSIGGVHLAHQKVQFSNRVRGEPVRASWEQFVDARDRSKMSLTLKRVDAKSLKMLVPPLPF